MTARAPIWKVATAAALVMLLLFAPRLTRPAPVTHIDTSQTSSMVTPRPPVVKGRVAFIGDSFTIGAGGNGQRWSSVLASKYGWDEVNLGIGGAGYVPQSYGDAYKFACSAKRPCPSYLSQAQFIGERRVETIFVSGGRNDIKASNQVVDANSRLLFEQLRRQAPGAKVYVISPFWSNGEHPDWLTAHAKVVKVNAQRAGFSYLEIGNPLANQPKLLAKDKIHPNGEGYQLLAETVDAAYRKAAS